MPEGARELNGGAFAKGTSPLPPNVTGGNNIMTWGQSGGINNLNVFNGEKLAAITTDTREQIRQRITSGAGVIIVNQSNDSASLQMEAQMRQALSEMGYKDGGSGIGIGGEYFRGFSVNGPRPDGLYTLIIGDPRAY